MPSGVLAAIGGQRRDINLRSYIAGEAYLAVKVIIAKGNYMIVFAYLTDRMPWRSMLLQTESG
jgi:hypothetical protein